MMPQATAKFPQIKKLEVACKELEHLSASESKKPADEKAAKELAQNISTLLQECQQYFRKTHPSRNEVMPTLISIIARVSQLFRQIEDCRLALSLFASCETCNLAVQSVFSYCDAFPQCGAPCTLLVDLFVLLRNFGESATNKKPTASAASLALFDFFRHPTNLKHCFVTCFRSFVDIDHVCGNGREMQLYFVMTLDSMIKHGAISVRGNSFLNALKAVDGEVFAEILFRLIRTNPSLESPLLLLCQLSQLKIFNSHFKSPKLQCMLLPAIFALARQSHFSPWISDHHALNRNLLGMLFEIVRNPECWSIVSESQPKELSQLLVAAIVRVRDLLGQFCAAEPDVASKLYAELKIWIDCIQLQAHELKEGARRELFDAAAEAQKTLNQNLRQKEYSPEVFEIINALMENNSARSATHRTTPTEAGVEAISSAPAAVATRSEPVAVSFVPAATVAPEVPAVAAAESKAAALETQVTDPSPLPLPEQVEAVAEKKAPPPLKKRKRPLKQKNEEAAQKSTVEVPVPEPSPKSRPNSEGAAAVAAASEPTLDDSPMEIVTELTASVAPPQPTTEKAAGEITDVAEVPKDSDANVGEAPKDGASSAFLLFLEAAEGQPLPEKGGAEDAEMPDCDDAAAPTAELMCTNCKSRPLPAKAAKLSEGHIRRLCPPCRAHWGLHGRHAPTKKALGDGVDALLALKEALPSLLMRNKKPEEPAPEKAPATQTKKSVFDDVSDDEDYATQGAKMLKRKLKKYTAEKKDKPERPSGEQRVSKRRRKPHSRLVLDGEDFDNVYVGMLSSGDEDAYGGEIAVINANLYAATRTSVAKVKEVEDDIEFIDPDTISSDEETNFVEENAKWTQFAKPEGVELYSLSFNTGGQLRGDRPYTIGVSKAPQPATAPPPQIPASISKASPPKTWNVPVTVRDMEEVRTHPMKNLAPVRASMPPPTLSKKTHRAFASHQTYGPSSPYQPQSVSMINPRVPEIPDRLIIPPNNGNFPDLRHGSSIPGGAHAAAGTWTHVISNRTTVHHRAVEDLSIFPKSFVLCSKVVHPWRHGGFLYRDQAGQEILSLTKDGPEHNSRRKRTSFFGTSAQKWHLGISKFIQESRRMTAVEAVTVPILPPPNPILFPPMNFSTDALGFAGGVPPPTGLILPATISNIFLEPAAAAMVVDQTVGASAMMINQMGAGVLPAMLIDQAAGGAVASTSILTDHTGGASTILIDRTAGAPMGLIDQKVAAPLGLIDQTAGAPVGFAGASATTPESLAGTRMEMTELTPQMLAYNSELISMALADLGEGLNFDGTSLLPPEDTTPSNSTDTNAPGVAVAEPTNVTGGAPTVTEHTEVSAVELVDLSGTEPTGVAGLADPTGGECAGDGNQGRAAGTQSSSPAHSTRSQSPFWNTLSSSTALPSLQPSQSMFSQDASAAVSPIVDSSLVNVSEGSEAQPLPLDPAQPPAVPLAQSWFSGEPQFQMRDVLR